MARKHSAQHQDNRAANGASPGPSGPSGLTPRQGKAPGHALPESARGNAWTRGKMARFLDALAQSASVYAAAASVGMSRQSAYRLRARLSGQPFDYAWEAALEFGLQQLAHAALDRALNGVEEPVFHAGEQIGTRTRYDERSAVAESGSPCNANEACDQAPLLQQQHGRTRAQVARVGHPTLPPQSTVELRHVLWEARSRCHGC